MKKKCTLFILLAMFVLSGGLSNAFALDIVPKVDNFIFLVDSSGSMGWEYAESGKTKIVLAKELLTRINRHIPEIGYVSVLETLAPLKTYSSPAIYKRAAYGKAIDALPTNILTMGFIGNPTPLGEDFMAMDSTLGCMQRRKALILISDGETNRGENPVTAAKYLYEKYSPNLCIHIISLADTPEGQKVLDSIAALNSCSASAKITDLESQDGLEEFAQQVFYGFSQDDDKDGVLNANDQCPNTPLGVVVNYLGCPLDTDGDGVPDYMDECPETPAGVIVDAKGCPVDTDQDGVPDYMDACPGTPINVAVDAKGCPEPISIDLEIEFSVDKADIRPVYHQKLAEVAALLNQHQGVSAVVEGYTDSKGAAKYNQQLSQRRAQSVVNYLTKKLSVDPTTLTANGYGEANPIADNSTPEGRQENRRVLVIISGLYQAR